MIAGIRIAMWCGPRTISTAMMRSWEHRDDCAVWDEPLYAWWLSQTGARHPGRDEILAAAGEDLDAASLSSRLSCASSPITYQKHMAHHLLEGFPRGWMGSARHAFLVRRPDHLLASLARRLGPEAITIESTGLPQQVALLNWLEQEGFDRPPIVDSDDVLEDPESILRALCAALGVPFDAAMCSWPPGPRASDGMWGRWWYDQVESSTGFGAPKRGEVNLPQSLSLLHDACIELYAQLADRRLRA